MNDQQHQENPDGLVTCDRCFGEVPEADAAHDRYENNWLCFSCIDAEDESENTASLEVPE